MSRKAKILVILGPTASGKSALAVKIAKAFKGEIISADSRQIYKGLNVAANKITKKEMAGIKHYLLDVVYPNQDFTLYDWQKQAFQTIKKIINRKKLPIICGGTGLYICSVLQNYDLHPTTPRLRNCPYDFLVLGLSLNRTLLYERINQRAKKMIRDGSLNEAKKLYRKYPNKNLPALSGIGYRELIQYLDKKITLPQAIELIQKNTRHYAKRQMTWFRRMERQGIKIHWNLSPLESKKLIKNFLE
ncbi:MAG: tRNA (adenosine(37)-N6)-dimethylallyltransferase MiaA [Patescibacteria group bacterium]